MVQTEEKLAQEQSYPQVFQDPLPVEINILGASGRWASSNDNTEVEIRIGGRFLIDVDEVFGNPFLWFSRKYKAFTLYGKLN